MKRIQLTKEEREIENNIEHFVPATGKKKKLLDAALAKLRKERAISLRVREQDLWQLKQRAAEEGLPYQTLITSILHKYTTDRLVDVNSARQLKQLLKIK